MYWVLGVAFQGDQSRIRTGHAGQNVTAVRRPAPSLLEQRSSLPAETKNKLLRARWDQDYLHKILQQA